MKIGDIVCLADGPGSQPVGTIRTIKNNRAEVAWAGWSSRGTTWEPLTELEPV